MTAPSYTEDLTDLTLSEEGSGWAESSDTAWDDQGPPAYQDQDYAYIQGSYSVTADTTKTGVGTLLWDYGSTFTVPTDGAMLIWINFYNPNALDTLANGGLRAIIGSADNTFWSWDVGGSDYGSYPYGGWQCFAVNDTVSADDTVNSYAGGSHQFVGCGVKVLTGIGKGESLQVDAIRVGRCSSIFEYGETADYATIAGYAAVNDATSARWGLIQAVAGGYLWKGRMQLGTSTNAVDFRDSDALIFIQDTRKVTANFNTIEVVNGSSNVEMTGFQFICLDPTNTASKGRWITTNDATVSLDACTFVDMSTFTFDSNTDAIDCVWRRCAQIDVGGGDISGAFVDSSTVTGGGSAGGGAVLWNDSGDPDTSMDGASFTKGAGSHHAVEFGTSAPLTINLTNMTFTDFSASNQQTTSAIYLPDKGSDQTWSIGHSGTTGTLSYYQARVGDTVNVVSNVPVTMACVDADNDPVQDVQCSVWKSSDGTQIMNEDSQAVTGIATENFNYPGTEVEIYWRARKSDDLDSPRYKAASGTGVIDSGGFSVTVTMLEQPLPI